MSVPSLIKPPAARSADKLGSAREAITYFRPMEDRDDDHAPLSARLIRRMFTYTRRYAARRNWLFVLTFARGLQLPALAWMIGQTITGPIAGRNLPGIYLHAGIYLVLVLLMELTFARGLQLPALAWMIGQTITGPIAGRNLPGIYLHAGIYLVLVLLME